MKTIFNIVFAAVVSIPLSNGAFAEEIPDWARDITALTVARSGAWGNATRPHSGAAIAAAIAECRLRDAPSVSDCGARQSFTRGGWSLGFACGDTPILAAERTLAEARLSAIHEEIRLRQIERIDLPPCRLLVAIDPLGRSADQNALSDTSPVPGLAQGIR